MHAVFALSCVPLFLGALFSDWAYFSSQQIQWVNFAAWSARQSPAQPGPHP